MKHSQGTQNDPDYPYPKPNPKYVFAAWLVGIGIIGTIGIGLVCKTFMVGEYAEDFWTVFMGSSLTWMILMAMTFQIKIADAQVEITKQQNRQTKELFILAERAHIGWKSVTPLFVELTSLVSPNVAIVFLNGGKTAAEDFCCLFGYELYIGPLKVHESLVSEVRPNPILAPGTLIVPNVEKTIVSQQMPVLPEHYVQAINNGDMRWFLLCRVFYKDVGNDSRSELIRAVYEPKRQGTTGGFYEGVAVPYLDPKITEHVLSQTQFHLKNN